MPDVVLARQDAYCTSMALAAARFDVPLVTYADAPVAYESRTFGGEWHRWHPPHLVESMESWTLRRSRAVVAVSRPAARRLDGYGLTTPVHVVPNGVDPSRFLPLDEADRAELRRQCGLTAPLVAGFAGTFKSFHGVDRLRELILATAHRRDTQWLLIGDGPDRPALEEALRGTSSVVFLGKRPASEIGRLLSLVDVAVAPHPPMDGDFYFCPLKVLEYAAAGCAVVATHQGDVPEILGHGRAGIVVSGSAIDDWVAAVNRLLDDEELRHALGRAARDRVLTRYTWTRTAERVEAVLLEATGRAEPKPPRCRGRNHLETYGPGDSFDALPTFTPALEAPPLPAQRARSRSCLILRVVFVRRFHHETKPRRDTVVFRSQRGWHGVCDGTGSGHFLKVEAGRRRSELPRFRSGGSGDDACFARRRARSRCHPHRRARALRRANAATHRWQRPAERHGEAHREARVFTLWHRKFLILFLLAVSGAGTYVGSSKLSKASYEVEATLLYSPLPVPEDGKSLYIPPDLKTLASLINSPKVIDTVREEFKIALPTKLMDKSLTVTIPGGTKAVKLALKWDDGAQAPLVLNRWTDVFIEQVASLRRAKLADHIKDFEGNLLKVQARLDGAIGNVRAFHRREGLVDFKNDVDNALKQITEYELALGQLKRSESETIAQDQRLNRHLEEVKKEESKEVERDKQFEAANESVSDNRRRQDRLRELIDEKRRVQEIQAMIDAKKLEADRVRRLVAKNAASKQELQQIESQVAVYEARIQEGEQIKNWRAELEKIDKIVIPDGAKKRQGSPIIQQTLYHKLELELHLIGIRDQIDQIHRGMKARRETLDRLDQLRNEYESLNRKVEAIDAERAKVESLIAMMRNLQNLKAAEFVVATAAEVPKFPASSNKKLYIAGIGGGGLALTFLVIAGLEWFTATWSCEARACQLGLPPLGWVEPNGRPYHRQQLRGLALRLRQLMPEPGAVVVFSTLSEPGQADETIHELASLLALRDERVLVLDTRIGVESSGKEPPLALPAPTPAPSRGAAGSASWPVDVFRLPNPQDAPARTDRLSRVRHQRPRRDSPSRRRVWRRPCRRRPRRDPCRHARDSSHGRTRQRVARALLHPPCHRPPSLPFRRPPDLGRDGPWNRRRGRRARSRPPRGPSHACRASSPRRAGVGTTRPRNQELSRRPSRSRPTTRNSPRLAHAFVLRHDHS